MYSIHYQRWICREAIEHLCVNMLFSRILTVRSDKISARESSKSSWCDYTREDFLVRHTCVCFGYVWICLRLTYLTVRSDKISARQSSKSSWCDYVREDFLARHICVCFGYVWICLWLTHLIVRSKYDRSKYLPDSSKSSWCDYAREDSSACHTCVCFGKYTWIKKTCTYLTELLTAVSSLLSYF